MTYSELYWITRLDSLDSFIYFLLFAAGFSSLVGIVLTIFGAVENNIEIDQIKIHPYLKRLIWCFSIVLLLGVFVPTSKQLALIYSGHFVTHSEQMQKLPDSLLRYLNTFLEDKKEAQKK